MSVNLEEYNVRLPRTGYIWGYLMFGCLQISLFFLLVISSISLITD